MSRLMSLRYQTVRISDTAQTDAEVGYLDEEDGDYEQSANDGFGDADEIYEDVLVDLDTPEFKGSTERENYIFK